MSNQIILSDILLIYNLPVTSNISCITTGREAYFIELFTFSDGIVKGNSTSLRESNAAQDHKARRTTRIVNEKLLHHNSSMKGSSSIKRTNGKSDRDEQL